MHPFDWGIFKPCGEAILLATEVIYLAALWWAFRQWLAVCLGSRRWWIPAIAAVIVLGGMLRQARSSIFWQRTSAHYQQSKHMIAVEVIFSGLVLSHAAGAIARKKVNKIRDSTK